MELRHVRYFLAVAEAHNFTRAAATLGIGQPPLSQQIKDLEDELGCRLFRRVPHGAELTAAGEAFQFEARAIVQGAERARVAAQRAARGVPGRLRVGMTGSAAFHALVPAAIRGFGRSYPDVLLTIEEANTQRLLARLGSGELDAAFLRPNAESYDGLRLQKLADEPMVLVLPASHALATRRRAHLAEFADDRIVLFPHAAGPHLHDAVTNACRAAGFVPRLGQEVPQIASIINFVAAEAGISVVPASLANIKVENVVYLRLAGVAPVARLSLAWRTDARDAILTNFLMAARAAGGV